MPLTPVPVERFNGLRLLPEQGEAAGSVSMLNADLSRDFTQIGSRAGLARLGTGTASYHRIAPFNSTSLLATRNTGSVAQLETVTISSGAFSAIAGTWGGSSTIVTSITPTGANEVLVTSRSGATNDVARGLLVSDLLAVAYAPRYSAVSPVDQRVALAHFTSSTTTPSGANGSTSTVFFSNPMGSIGGIPSIRNGFTTFADTDWIKLDPVDGDEITGMVAWRELLFVIKRSALYVFYSTSIDSTGSPTFIYRKINLPARARATTNRGGENIVAGGDGVYLLLSDGVYRTTGDLPQLVSRDITPLFDGTGDSASVFPSTGDWTIGYATNRVYLSYQNGSSYRTLVYDEVLREWLLWDISVGASAIPTNVIEWIDTNNLPTGYIASGAKVFSFTKTATDDDGTAITSSYQSGFDGLGGAPSQEKKARNVEVVGSGAPTFTVLTDYATSDPLSRQAAVTLGTAPAIDTAVHAKAYRGRLFSYKFSASAAWTVTRLTWNLQSIRPPGMRSS